MTTATGDPVRLRFIIRNDMPRVLEIENASYNDPWGEKELTAYLRCRACIGMVAYVSEHVVGFVLYEMKRKYILLESIAVCPEYRRLGVGSVMIDKLKSRLKPRSDREYLEAFIKESNLGGQVFMRSNGFVATQLIRCPDDENPHEDAYRMEYRQGPRRVHFRNRITT